MSAKRPVVLNLIVGPSLSLSDFSLPVSFENAEIGQCPNIAPPPAPLPLPDEEEPEEEKEVSKPLSPPLTPTPSPGPPAVSGYKLTREHTHLEYETLMGITFIINIFLTDGVKVLKLNVMCKLGMLILHRRGFTCSN